MTNITLNYFIPLYTSFYGMYHGSFRVCVPCLAAEDVQRVSNENGRFSAFNERKQWENSSS
jgi:hypothetical protein